MRKPPPCWRRGATAWFYDPGFTDGKTLATANGDGTILLWRTPPRPVATAKAGKPIAKLAAAKEADDAALPAAPAPGLV